MVTAAQEEDRALVRIQHGPSSSMLCLREVNKLERRGRTPRPCERPLSRCVRWRAIFSMKSDNYDGRTTLERTIKKHRSGDVWSDPLPMILAPFAARTLTDVSHLL